MKRILCLFALYGMALCAGTGLRAESVAGPTAPATKPLKHAPPSEPVTNLTGAVTWLQGEAHRLIRLRARPMADGTTAFPPGGYKAFWLRDYAYALEGSNESFSDKELMDACRLFVKSIREDGAAVDCVKFEGIPIYQPGYGRMGREPVLDGPPFTVDVAWRTYQRLKDKALLKEILDPLVKTMEYMPRNAKNGLAHIASRNERREYGFTDSILFTGDTLFCSLLFVQATRQLGDLLEADGRPEQAAKWRAEGERVAESIRRVFWDAEVGLFRSSTGDSNVPYIWGSAFAVWLNVASPQQAQAIAGYFKQHYGEIVQAGQVRHLPGFTDWSGNRTEKNGGAYQRGAFWATPVGWFVYTLDLADPALADQTVVDMVRHFQKYTPCECIDGEYRKLGGYVASAALPLAGIRAMIARRSMPVAQGLTNTISENQGAQGDRVKHFTSLSTKEKLIFAVQDKELLASRAQLADISGAGENPYVGGFPAPRAYSTHPNYRTKLETKDDGLSYKSTVSFDEQVPPLQGFLTNNFIPTVKKYCEGGHLKVDFDSLKFSIAERPNTDDLNVYEDIPYNILGERALVLDLYVPKAAPKSKAYPVLLFFHGGGWLSGHHYSNRSVAISMAKKGFATVVVEYRLGVEAIFPAAVWDGKAAVRWVRKHAEKYNLDPNMILVSGGSAGGNIAGLVGMTNGDPRFEGDGNHKEFSSDVQGVIAYDGAIHQSNGNWTGGGEGRPNPMEENPWFYNESIPLFHIISKDGGVPILFVKGGRPLHVWIKKYISNIKVDWLYNGWVHGFEVFDPSKDVLVEELIEYFKSDRSLWAGKLNLTDK